MGHLSTAALLLLIACAAGCAQDTTTGPSGMLSLEPAAFSTGSATSCANARGAVEGNFAAPGGFILQGLGTALVTVVALDVKGAKGQATIHSVTMHQINTARGEIMTSDEGILAPVDPPLYRLNHRWTITGGTGDFQVATGFLHPHALINLATGEIEGFFHGRICA